MVLVAPPSRSALVGLPSFRPHPWFRGGHLQTLAGSYRPRRPRVPSFEVRVGLPDGDALTVLISRGISWRHGDPLVVMVHGLCGTAESPYVARPAQRLLQRGWLTARVNLREAGSGAGLSRKCYHAGQSDDIRAVAEELARRYPDSPIALAGYSMGGNLVLKLAAEAADRPVANLERVVAVNPPIDLGATAHFLDRTGGGFYQWRLLRMLRAMVRRHQKRHPDLPRINLARVRTMVEFDNAYTARVHGFRDAHDYYAQSSSRPILDRIRVPGLILHAINDPLIPAETFLDLDLPEGLRLDLRPDGGHLGYVSRTPWMGDRRWMDARLVTWLARQEWSGRSSWGEGPGPQGPVGR